MVDLEREAETFVACMVSGFNSARLSQPISLYRSTLTELSQERPISRIAAFISMR